MNSNNRIAATLFPRDIVCLRNISINTLHKGDDDDDDNNNILRWKNNNCIFLIGAVLTEHPNSQLTKVSSSSKNQNQEQNIK